MIMVRSIAFRLVESIIVSIAAVRCTTLKFACAGLSSSALESAAQELQHFAAPDIGRLEAKAAVTFFVRLAVRWKDHSPVRLAGGLHIRSEEHTSELQSRGLIS